MKFVILFACLCAAVSAFPTEHELSKRDAISDSVMTWAQKLYESSETLRQKLIAYRQTHKDKWASEGSNKSRAASAALKLVLKGLEAAQETFKTQILDHPEKVEEAKDLVLTTVMDKVRDVIFGKKEPDVVAKEIEKEIATESAVRSGRY